MLAHFRTKLARLRAGVRRLTVVCVLVEPIPNAEQLARPTLHRTELHTALQIDHSALEGPLELHHTRMASLEAHQV